MTAWFKYDWVTFLWFGFFVSLHHIYGVHLHLLHTTEKVYNMAAPEIPKKQKAAVYDQPGSVSTKIVELDVPEPGSGEVLINLYV